jgi:HAD superfamily hydrolase (TIGR01459 family)
MTSIINPSGAPKSPRFISGLREIAADYDVILCDVWGVVHNGVVQFEATADALRRFRAKGGRVVLITNAPRPRDRVVAFLDRLQVSHEAYDGVVTSGDVTISLIRERAGRPLAYIGPPEDAALFDAAQAGMTEKLRFVRFDEAAYAVCIGLEYPETETPTDYEARLRVLQNHGAEFICANPDIVVEMGDKLVYCAGALAEIYETLGGRVIQAGKPHAEIYARAIALAAALPGGPIDSARVLAIGDSAETDIRGGRARGFATLFVTSGIHRAELHGGSGSGPLNRAALHQFLGDLSFAPTVIMPELVW